MDYEKIAGVLAWPVVGLILGLCTLAMIREPIKGFLSKMRSINAGGVTMEAPPEAQRNESEKSNQEAVHQLLLGVSETPAMVDLDAKIRQDLLGRGLQVDGDVPKVLIRYLASAGLLLQFEQVHALILGSQISLLKKLNAVRGVGRPFAFVTAHIDEAKSQNPPIQEWTYKQYLDFLIGRNLVRHNEDSAFITDFGIEYLTWIVRMGRNEDKPN